MKKIQKSLDYINRKYVKKTGTHLFAIGSVVLMNIKKRIKDIKNVVVRWFRWIGPCTVSIKDQENFISEKVLM